ncbi:MAG: homoserine O-succinyltransferase [Bryobacterales bacterium]|nr:homoserine O-succinyltransferase [Bryobacterales bacterium]MBV9398789.1 homoserine O-succinyltransferase [Bryobacterales bacterium]
MIAPEWDIQHLCIGLVNNMPDAVKPAAERQFRDLLAAAAQNVCVSVSVYSLETIDALWGAQLDGLIVTGREPRTRTLTSEPYWPTLAAVIEWAERNTYSTIWSCLAAHAAVLHIDGIERRALNQKLFGVFDCAKVAEHPLMSATPSRWCVPHSRWNDLAAHKLEACCYRILTRSPQAGADIFIKHRRRSLFVFCQGHPEYDSETLWLEYRRDLRRFLQGLVPRPSLPHGNTYGAAWRPGAIRLYRNWLDYLHSRKSLQHNARLRLRHNQAGYAQASQVGR